jgi:(R,R)-butanediol dehydrogenase/meso-butanediol dehydrogenase/diacetyl reductase
MAETNPNPSEMRATVYQAKRQLRVENRDVPEPGPDEVLLRISHCGICGTDLHLVMEGWGSPGSIGGHEYSGVVVAVGANVRQFAADDHVVGTPEHGCGQCEYCTAHRPSLCTAGGEFSMDGCDGAFAEYMRVPQHRVVRIPRGLSLRDAALAEPLAVALHGITLSQIKPGQRALVLGAGPIGALTIAVLRTRGVDEIVVSEPGQARRALARKLGASLVVEPDALEIPPMPFTIAADAVDCAYECSGKASAVETALAQLRKAGRLVLLGTGMERASLDGNRVILNELEITGAYNYDEAGFTAALELLAAGLLPTRELLEAHDYGLDEMLPAMEALVSGELAGKVLVAPGKAN